MIDNFFRLHEKNRQLNWDDYFGKARYDHPHAFGSCAQPLAGAASPAAAVDEALQQALYQLPACASLDLAIVAVHSSDAEEVDAILAHLALALPASTRVVGWAGTSLGEAVAPSLDGLGATVVGGGSTPTVSITLASIPSVSGRGFFVSEDELRLWKAQGATEMSSSRISMQGQQEDDEEMADYKRELAAAAAATGYLGPDKKWEHRAGVTLNEAYKDPPVFLLFGNLEDASLAQVALQGLDCTYPGTARIGGLSEGVVLFSREGGSASGKGGRILKEEGTGLLGLALVGDIRALTYVNQGAVRVPEQGIYRIDAVSEDGMTITQVSVPGSSSGGKQTPAAAGMPATMEGGMVLALGEEGDDKVAEAGPNAVGVGGTREGADRWSLVSVRGSKQAAAVLKDGWTVGADGSLRLNNRMAKVGQYLSVYKHDAATALAQEAELVAALRKEIDDEWSKAELGVMKFRPTGVLMSKAASYPSSGLAGSFGEALTQALPTAPLAGLGAGTAQVGPLDPRRSSALFQESLVVSVLACKAKRRDVREIRFFDHWRGSSASVASGGKKSPLDLPFDPEKPLLEKETGEVAVNRQAALIGTDVRVDNMAWNVREESVYPRSLFECMVWTKERELYFVREDAPLMNLMRTVMMMIKNPDAALQAKARGLDVVAALKTQTDEKGWAVLGDISRGTPFQGVLAPLFDAVQATHATIAASGAGAVALRVDQTYYGGKYQHVRDVKDALREARVPVVADDLVLYPYQLYLAKLFGADGVKMGQLSVLSDEDLQYQVKICQTLSLTPIISVASLSQLRRAAALPLNQTSVLTLDDRDWTTMRVNPGEKHRAVEWLQDPAVQASLKARREGGAGAGGAPLILVEGRSKLTEMEKEELRGLGVSGEVFAFADLPASERIEAGRKGRMAGVSGGVAAAAAAAMGGGATAGGNSMESLKELLRAKAAASSTAGP
jgi:indole-3-glycerol phosphate synthase